MDAREMTVSEAAEALGIDPSVVRRRIRLGEMQARRVGPRLYLIPTEEVARHKAMGRLKPGPKPGKSGMINPGG